MIFVITKNKLYIDDIGYNIISKLRSNNMDKIVKIITNIGGTIVIGIVTIISLFIFRNKKINICIVLNLLGIVVLNNVIIKNIIGRDRPSDINIITEAGKSFPSGHSAVSMVVYGYLIYLTYNYIKNKKIKYLLISILSILILVVGLTRIYLGVHYTSDVLGGYLLGIVYLLLFTYISDKYIKEKPKSVEKKSPFYRWTTYLTTKQIFLFCFSFNRLLSISFFISLLYLGCFSIVRVSSFILDMILVSSSFRYLST